MAGVMRHPSRLLQVGMQAGEVGGGDDHASRYIILALLLGGRSEILSNSEGAPGAIAAESHPQIAGHELLIPVFEFNAGHSINGVDAETLLPIGFP